MAASASISCHNGRICSAVAVSFEVPDATGRTTTYITDRHGGPLWRGWSSAAAGYSVNRGMHAEWAKYT